MKEAFGPHIDVSEMKVQGPALDAGMSSSVKNELSLELEGSGDISAIEITTKEGAKKVPVLSIRNPEHHLSIAQAITSGSPVAFEVGVIGIMIAVEDPRSNQNDSWRKFWEIKRGRLPQDKVPMMLHPKDHPLVVDYSKLHANFRYLESDSEARDNFYGQLPVHTILPFRDDVEHVNRDTFVTTPDDTKSKPQDQRVDASTVCVYFQKDEDWQRIAELAEEMNPNVLFGITSFNDHGKPSPFNFTELLDYIKTRESIDFDYVVRDPVIEQADIRSSHTQVRLPLENETPEIIVVRKGPITAEKISEVTGHPVRELESAKVAARGHDNELDLYPHIERYIASAREHVAKRGKKE